jgi:hypothetical protein
MFLQNSRSYLKNVSIVILIPSLSRRGESGQRGGGPIIG